MIRYYAGGLVVAALAKNQAEQYDDVTQTYTAWDQTGNVTATRAYTAAESASATAAIAQATATVNAATLRTQAQTALANNTTYVGIATPTNAQVVAQVQALTRQTNAIIRLLIGQLDALT